jgi:serine O-acetyltransferase
MEHVAPAPGARGPDGPRPAGGLRALAVDRTRYAPHAWATDPCLWSVAAFRFAQEVRGRGPAWLPLALIAHILQLIAYTVGGSELPATAEVGPGLCIKHGQGIVVHGEARIGANCTLRQGVTIGNRHDGGAVPVLADGVTVGAYAQILGDIRVGAGAQIGAMSVVLADVPAGATAVGSPARIVAAR